MPYREPITGPIPLPDGPIPLSGPGSIRYRRLFGLNEPLSWAQLEFISRDGPVTVEGLFRDVKTGATATISIAGEGLVITPCNPSGSWEVYSNVYNRTACTTQFDFAASPSFPQGTPLSNSFLLARFQRVGSVTTVEFLSNNAQKIIATWQLISGSC